MGMIRRLAPGPLPLLATALGLVLAACSSSLGASGPVRPTATAPVPATSTASPAPDVPAEPGSDPPTDPPSTAAAPSASPVGLATTAAPSPHPVTPTRPAAAPSTAAGSLPAAAAPVAAAGTYALGDSVMLGAAAALHADLPGIVVDAAESRQATDGIAVLRAQAAAGRLGRVVVVHLGTNGTFTLDQVRQVVALAGGHRLVLLTDHAARSWTATNNANIRAGCTGSCRLLDWNAAAAANPGWFYADGIHLDGPGRLAYARLVTGALG